MIVVVNKKSGGGTAFKKWKRLSKILKLGNGSTKIIYVGENGFNKNFVKDALSIRNTNFVIAGGDGTINHFLNFLISTVKPEILKNIRIGAVGIGSSNDFHKPYRKESFIEHIPVKLNFKDAVYRDIGCLQFKKNGTLHKKYFLINASIGITAEGNNFFNNPDTFLKILKRINTQSAITYAAIKNIFAYKNFNALIECNGLSCEANISNMGIIKCPYFTGKLRYQSEPEINNGLFDVHLYQSLSKAKLIKLFYNLSKGIPDNSFNKLFCRTDRVKISSEKEFAVEYDGEVITTKSVVFYVMLKLIKVCIN